jgi:hypothetical protein
VPSVPSAVPKPSAYDTHVNREMSAKAFEARQTPAFKATVGERTYTPQQVQEKRSVFYTTVYRDRYIPPPAGTSYGSFSEQFMWAMMFNAAFAYNRSDDPAYRQWRRDADERALTDQKVKDQLAELDRQVKDLAGKPKDANFVPADTPPEVIFTEASLTDGGGSPSNIATVLLWVTFLSLAGGTILIFLVRHNRRFA